MGLFVTAAVGECDSAIRPVRSRLTGCGGTGAPVEENVACQVSVDELAGAVAGRSAEVSRAQVPNMREVAGR